MGGGLRADRLDRALDEHGDVLFDFALAVTGDHKRAAEAVCQAVSAVVVVGGPAVSQAALLGAVLDAALRRADRPSAGREGLFRPGPGTHDELQHLARAATQVLDPHRRGVLDLVLRQGLDGEEMAEALGVSPGLASATTKAALDEAEQIVGAVLVARLGQRDCPGLAAVLGDPALGECRRRAAAVNHHVEECLTCGDRRRALVPVGSLLASVPPTPAPPELRRGLLDARWAGPPAAGPGPGSPEPRRHPSRQVRLLAAGLVTVVIATSAALALASRWRPAQRPAGGSQAGRLALRTGPLDFGPTEVNRSFEVANTGRQPLHYNIQPGAPWVRVVSGAGTLAPGQQVVVGVAVDRTEAPEGEARSEVRVQSSGGSAVIPVRAGVERPPGLSGLEATPRAVVQLGCPGSNPARVRAVVVEESGVGHVELRWRGPDRIEGMGEMVRDGPSSFAGSLGPFPTAGAVSWWISATDIRGNSATSPPESLRVSGC